MWATATPADFDGSWPADLWYDIYPQNCSKELLGRFDVHVQRLMRQIRSLFEYFVATSAARLGKLA